MSRLAALLLLATLPWPFDALVPSWLDRALYNPRERTEAALEAYHGGDAEAAAKLADKALEVAPRQGDGEAPADPRVAFNAGTAHLAAGDAEEAGDLLAEAAAGADDAAPGLAPAAHYNLGNAQLAAGDNAAAVESYKEALRRAPDDADAKYNLEVALRRLEEQRKMQAKQPQETPGGDRQGDQEQGDRGGEQHPNQGDQQRSDAADRGQGQPQGENGEQKPQAGAEGSQPQPQSERPLPQFKDQPDMTAEQAAALLESVENLERRQRQEQAAERARRKAARGEKDW